MHLASKGLSNTLPGDFESNMSARTQMDKLAGTN